MADPTRTPQTQPRLENDRGVDAERARQNAEASSGAGLVRVQVDGRGTLRSLVIAPEAFEGRDADLLADLVMAAVSEAQRRLDDHG